MPEQVRAFLSVYLAKKKSVGNAQSQEFCFMNVPPRVSGTDFRTDDCIGEFLKHKMKFWVAERKKQLPIAISMQLSWEVFFNCLLAKFFYFFKNFLKIFFVCIEKLHNIELI